MNKRYIRIDIEYQVDDTFSQTSWTTVENIKRTIKEDMPYVKVLHTRDSPNLSDLDRIVWTKE